MRKVENFVHCSVQTKMLQLPSNSTRNLHGNSSAGSEHHHLHAHPGVINRSQPPPAQPQTPVPATPHWQDLPQCQQGELEQQGTLGAGVKFAPTLCSAALAKQSMEAHRHAPGIAQPWTMHLLL